MPERRYVSSYILRGTRNVKMTLPLSSSNEEPCKRLVNVVSLKNAYRDTIATSK